MTLHRNKEEKPNLKYLRDRDKELVKGIFRFHEVPGGKMEFVYKCYKEDQPEKYSMIDGEVYSIPLGVAKHLNNNCWYAIHAFAQDEFGRVAAKVGQKVRRCSFQSLEFVDSVDLTPVGVPSQEIITVERI